MDMNSVITYRVKLINSFNEDYMWSSQKENSLGLKPDMPKCTHTTYDEYVMQDDDAFIDAVRCLVDPPEHEMNVNDVIKEFDLDAIDNETSKYAYAIVEYYNGRLALWNKMYECINHIVEHIDETTHQSFKFSIPEEHNSFSLSDDDPYKNSKQLQAYIEIEITKNTDENTNNK